MKKPSNTKGAPAKRKAAGGAQAAKKATVDAAQVAEAVKAWQELRTAINRFNRLPTEVLKAVAAGRIRWPIMAGLDAGAIRDADEILHSIALSSGINVRNFKRAGEHKSVDIRVPINDLALCYIHAMIDHRSRQSGMPVENRDAEGKLPPFTKKTAREWAKVAWASYLSNTTIMPENDPELKNIGAHKSEKYARISTSGRTNEKTRSANIRAGIAEAFAQAFIRLARD